MRCPSLSPRFAGAVTLAACALALPASAAAQSPLEQYQRTGTINPCSVTGGPGEIPSDVEQYAPDFLEALKDAQRRGCDRGNRNATSPASTDDEGTPVAANGAPLPPGSSYVPKPPAPPKLPAIDAKATGRHLPLAAAGEAKTPAPVLGLAVFLLVGLAWGGAAATWRYMGWGLEWLDPVRHGFSEAGHRAGGAASTAADWARAVFSRRGA
jgi:hypothetical protein